MLPTLTSRPATRLAVAFGAFAFGAAVLLAGTGFARPADDKKEPAEKKADEKKPAFDPKDVRVGPPPELAALRAAVEEAARKGENVDEVRKQLEALEKALAGKAWVKPKPVEEPAPPPAAFPVPPAVRPLPVFPGGLPFQPGFPGGGFQPVQPDLDALIKAQDLLLKAAELLADDPVANREKVEAMRKEAQELMARALGGGRGLFLPGMAAGGNGRLGVRVEKVPAGLADQFDVPAGRGILVADVVKGTPAEKAGFQPNDVVLEFAGQPVTDEPAAFVRMVQAAKGGPVDVVVLRKGKKETIKGVELPAQPGRGAGLDPAGGARRAVAAARLRADTAADGAQKRSVTVRVQNGMFTITAEENGVKYVMEGPADGGKLVPAKVVVTDGDKKIEEKDVEKLPAEYRDKAKKILAEVKIGK
jgi:hypothetical protein